MKYCTYIFKKGKLKETLVKTYTKNIDYKVEKEKEGKISKSNKEIITLTPDCFKRLCLLSKTKKAEEVRTYYLELENGFDSLMTVNSFRNFLWDSDKNDLVNRKGIEKWPRTQDLKIYYEIDSAVFLTSRQIYINNMDRIGNSPYLYELDKIKSTDIDWPEDFKLAEVIYSYLLTRES